MKNFKKIALGLMVGALAIGFSAFTNAKKATTTMARYYNQRTDHNPSNVATDYIFINDDVDLCTSSLTKECSAQWNTTNVPTEGQTPADAGSPSKVASSGTLGIFSN
jgi:hypothetical protein